MGRFFGIFDQRVGNKRKISSKRKMSFIFLSTWKTKQKARHRAKLYGWRYHRKSKLKIKLKRRHLKLYNFELLMWGFSYNYLFMFKKSILKIFIFSGNEMSSKSNPLENNVFLNDLLRKIYTSNFSKTWIISPNCENTLY